jgi:hypothetical protein
MAPRRSSSEGGSQSPPAAWASVVLTELEACAVGSGASTAGPETNRALVEAIAMYRSAGYVVPAFDDEPFAHHWFEKELG